jgi:preprotein translocase subunit SecG
MNTLIQGLQTISALLMIGCILLQQGKGADVGSSFGSGASNTFFGSRGSATFLSRLTGWLAVLFFLSSLWMVRLEAPSKADKKAEVVELVDTLP